ncbi:AGE family epimerase/isomerase [Chitinophaga japonensis]|uniref:N-acylglucosamine 2-epimerase n=1 Tax=Chitinophaga japonensis TaxID=104662 RepID=A0A562TGC0_CHIJA|nr:AGE family epimerase/isomerase [Chitinophaga japonensis]TWI92383.1 N-acylglucosamine 2-epimerase [Chitinophaga japonensis]
MTDDVQNRSMVQDTLAAAPPEASYAALYRDELLERVLPFWLKHSKDEQHGGYYTCLLRDGRVFDTDKFMWLQGREVWCFSYMYNNVAPREEWLQMALHGAAFMEKYGRDAAGNWYFSLTADGRPLTQPYNIFSDCFAAMAFAALDKAAPDDRYKEIAVSTFKNILQRKDNWKGVYSKAYAGTRPLKGFSLPMILCNLSLELEHLLGAQQVNELIPAVIHEVMEVFYQPAHGLIVENVYADGRFSDSFDGRLLNPGHAIEAMWFIMDLGQRLQDKALVRKACDIMLHTLEYGWDKEQGGIFYFMDLLGHPPQQLEWDQKLWWVHVEALVALSKGYALTGDERCRQWFETVHRYTWQHFRDEQHGEWFGYLNRKGEVLLQLKGGKWKGCFHVPRALYQVWKTWEQLSQ